MDPSVSAATTNLKKNYALEIRQMSLSGGGATSEHTFHPGSVVDLRLNPDGKTIRMQAVIRTATPQLVTFEIVDISLEDRAKLRKLFAQNAANAKPDVSPNQAGQSQQTLAPVSS
jgi:hypothetical protein